MPDEPFLSYFRSPQFRTIFVDGIASIMLSDAISDRVLASFTRFDVLPVREKATSLAGGRMELIPGVVPDRQPQKTVEATLEIRPDVALAIANNLLTTLSNLPKERKDIYGIPATVGPISAAPPRDR
jgi:hypothetical protein